MESNEQTEPASKIETDSQIESKLTALGGCGRGEIEQKRIRERTHGHRQVWLIVQRAGVEWVEVKESIGGINGNGKIQ